MVQLIQAVANLLSLIIIVDVLAGWVISNPYNPFRQALHSIVEPMVAPIRRFLPLLGMIDFSPMVLLIVIQVLEVVLIKVLSR